MTDSKFSLRDYFALGFSFVALVISSVGLYYNNFKVNDNLQVKFLGLADFGQKPSGDAQTTQILILNAGNRPGIVLSIETKFSPTDGQNAQIILRNPEDFPVILQPYEMKLITLKIPHAYIFENSSYFSKFAILDPAGHVLSSITGGPKKSPKLFVWFDIKSMDSDAGLHEISTPNMFACKLDSSGTLISISVLSKYDEKPLQISLYTNKMH